MYKDNPKDFLDRYLKDMEEYKHAGKALFTGKFFLSVEHFRTSWIED